MNLYSKDALVDFLGKAMDSGKINPSTGQAKKSAVLAVFECLDDNQAADLRHINFEYVFDEFKKRNAQHMESGSIATYKSRAKKALDEFLKWRENPEEFSFKTRRSRSETASHHGNHTAPSSKAAAQRIELLIREGIMVQIVNLPFDLRQDEADRIKKIIDAYVS